MILASSKKLVRQLLTQTVPYVAAISSHKNSNWSEVLDESVPSRRSDRDFQTLDADQRDALSASLDLTKPMVTVLGSPGTGKTLVVTELVYTMCTKQKRRVLVVCGSRELMYATVCRYFRRARCSDHFVHLQPFDEETALRVAPDAPRVFFRHHPGARKALAQRSLIAMVARRGGTVGLAKVLQSPTTRDQTRLVFATPDDVFALLRHSPHKKQQQQQPGDASSSASSSVPPPPQTLQFDAVVLEDVAALKGADDWRQFLQLAPLLRVVADPHHSIAIPPKQIDGEKAADNTSFQCSVVQQIAPNKKESPVFVLTHQYRGNMNLQIWTARTFYAPNPGEIDLGRPVPYSQHELRLNHLMDRLVTDEQSVYTDSLTLVDTEQLDGHWAETMFQPSEMVEWANTLSGLVNWGEALLAAVHIKSLLSFGICPFQIACLTHSSAHGEAIRRILVTLDSSLLPIVTQPDGVAIGRVEQYLGRSFEAITKSFITDAVFTAYFRNQRALHYLSAEITISNRQLLMIGPLRRFFLPKLREAYEFVTLFRQRGTILTPSDLLPLQNGQFETIIREAKGTKSKLRGSTTASERNRFVQQQKRNNETQRREQRQWTDGGGNGGNGRRAGHHSA